MAKRTTNVTKKRRATEIDIPLHDEVFLQPWFLPRPIYAAIRRLLPGVHLAKMRYYFDDYGCLRCGERSQLYGSNGLCERCSVVVRYRVVQSLRRRLKRVGVMSSLPMSDGYADQAQLARRLLRGFSS